MRWKGKRRRIRRRMSRRRGRRRNRWMRKRRRMPRRTRRRGAREPRGGSEEEIQQDGKWTRKFHRYKEYNVCPCVSLGSLSRIGLVINHCICFFLGGGQEHKDCLDGIKYRSGVSMTHLLV